MSDNLTFNDMDRSWMYDMKRNDANFLEKVEGFIKCALDYQLSKSDEAISCPCKNCKNRRRFRSVDQIRDHIIRHGFRPNYTRWIWHGESILCSSYNDDSGVTNNSMDSENVLEDSNNNEMNDENDCIHQMFHDDDEHLIEEPALYERILSDAEKPLFSGCDKFTKLSAVFKLFNLKAKYGWSDKSFTMLLILLKDMLPENNELPTSTYEAKKMMCPLGMGYKKIHACPNDCILYRNEYENLHECPKCGLSRYKSKSNVDNSDKKHSPAKVLWYLPVIPRFKRLFSNKEDAKKLRWHAEERKNDGLLRHPADSPQWRNIDTMYPNFSKEIRNLRLGLCTDGINPFGNLSSQHSTWPVLLVIYNLPPYLSMKRKYIMLSLLISGPRQPGNDIDVYLAPLIEDLNFLWNTGVQVYDAYSKSNFTLRAMIFCTINDFPAYGNLSGYSVKGAKACPICQDDMVTERLHFCKKNVYMHHRRFLPLNHPYRTKKKPFNGFIETGVARLPLTGNAIYELVKNIENNFGKTFPLQGGSWKKMSIFWELPYWRNLQVRHCLDVMHIEKNVCDSIIGTLLNIPGKTKDGENARKDMLKMGIRTELAPKEDGKRTWLPPACYTLSKKEKISLCECLHSVKVPAGYSSNISSRVSMTDLKLTGMKSHDCHVLMQHLLPIAIRGVLPKHLRYVITKLCFFFNAICGKVIDPNILDDLQADVIVTLCQLEMYFPPSFFDVMIHLVVHLVREIKICGPVFLRYMYPFEMHMGTLKRKMKNKHRPEASIIEGIVAEEVIEFATQYLTGVEPIGLCKSRHEERLEGHGTIGLKLISIGEEMFQKAHLLVLQHLSEVHPYLEEHMAVLKSQNPLKNEMWLTNEHNRSFVTWFKDRVMSQLSQRQHDISDTIKWLAYGPRFQVNSYEGYDINGYIFYTKRQDEKSKVQNSGVSVVASSIEFANAKDNKPVNATMSYFGVIEDIWELEYKDFTIPLFRCKWVDNHRAVQVDEHGFTLVDFGKKSHDNDPLILASQAKQVFYVTDPADHKWSVVLPGKRRIVGVGDVVDEEEYNQFDENPPFAISVSLEDEVDINTSYARSDHNEGFWIM